MKVSEIMTRDVTTATPDTTIAQLAHVISEKNLGGLPIVDENGELVGIVTESNLLPKMKKVPFSNIKLPALFHEWVDEPGIEPLFKLARDKKAGEVMSTKVVSVEPNDTVLAAAIILGERGFRRLPVVEDGRLVGIVSRGDILRALAKANEL